MSERPDIDLQTEANHCHQWWLDQGTRAGPYHEVWQGWAARARIAVEREREMQRQYDGLRIDWVAAVYDKVQYETLLKKAHASLCSLQCPSQWKTDEPQPHCDLCQGITAALKKGPSDD